MKQNFGLKSGSFFTLQHKHRGVRSSRVRPFRANVFHLSSVQLSSLHAESDMRLIRQRLILAFLLTMPRPPIIGQSSRPAGPRRPREYTFKVINVFPHDTAAFTQGLVYRDGFLYEGTGLNGRSQLRKVRLETGEVVQHADLDSEFFGEGIAIAGNKVIQLTWQSHVGFVYNLSDFKLLRQFSYRGEGWGLTSNGNDIFMSDGSAQVRVLNAVTLKEKRRFTVRDGATAIDQLNELEYVEGEIFANIWQTDRIVRISPVSGKVVGWIDLTGLLSPVFRRREEAVLNGIAYDAAHKRLFVTGKLWPSIFEIQLVPKNSAPLRAQGAPE
jgi:glutamine cyclotransferase